MLDTTDLITVAGIVGAFSSVVLFFRIDRELRLRERGVATWIPWADWLVVASAAWCFLLGILPLLIFGKADAARAVATAFCAGSVLLVSGYAPAILSHYRLILGRRRRGPTLNPEPAERVVVLATAALAIAVAAVLLVVNLRLAAA